MSRVTVFLVAVSALLAAGIAPPAHAQCTSYNFENLAVGTIVTNQYEGVTFSVVGQSCSGLPTIYMRIANQFYGDSFGSKVLLIDTGCPDFSSDYVRMVFDVPQGYVSFTLGPWNGTYAVRAYSTVSGGSPISTQNVVVLGSGFVACHRLVEVNSATHNIRRIEIQESVGQSEAIDELSFGADDTPPTAQIASPTVMDCASGSVHVTGIACDEDGQYASDRLEYLRVYPASGSTWTLIDDATTPVCETDGLYYWDTSDAEITEGLYVLRLTVTNACGLSSSAVTTVSVDKDFDIVDVRQPESGAILGGTFCIDGTAWDEFCFDHYVVEYRPSGGGAWMPVDPGHATYSSPVTVDPLANWATVGVVADGTYNVHVVGTSHAGFTRTQVLTLVIDNTPPLAQIKSPSPCDNVEGTVTITGTASDAHLDEWQLDYYVPTTRTWQPLTTGHSSITNNLLWEWNTAGLPACYYTLRLRVWDNSIVGLCSDPERQYAEAFQTIAIGDVTCPGDVNGDGEVDFYDINPFVALLLSGPLPIECP